MIGATTLKKSLPSLYGGSNEIQNDLAEYKKVIGDRCSNHKWDIWRAPVYINVHQTLLQA